MKAFLAVIWAAVILMSGELAIRATLVSQESFNYGSEQEALSGMNGGSGFGAPWSNDTGMGEFDYVPTGLTFGSLMTSGGAAQVGTVSNVAPYFKAEISRQYNLLSNLAGSIYGSYLFYIPYYGTSGRDSQAVLFGGTNITTTGLGGSPDNYAQLDTSGLYYDGGSKGNVRLAGTGGSVSGTTISTNTTYLALWEADGLVTSGSGSQQLTLWVLTLPQFEYFKANGLTNSILNAATLGSASNNITERAAVSGTYAATFLTNSFLGLYATFDASNMPIGMIVDEIRVGTAGIDEVTPTSSVPASPQIIEPPASQSAYVGTTVQISVDASGYPGLSYQWRAGAVGSGVFTNLSDNENVSGSESATLTLIDVSSENAADYVVVVSNSVGAVTSSPPATLSISAMPLPVIVAPPVSQSVQGGAPSVQLTVTATGSDLSYQWMIGTPGSGTYAPIGNVGNISGAASPTLTLTDVSANNAGDYVVAVSNSAGSVTSTPPATLSFYYTTNSVPCWGLGPFYRPSGVNPIISSNITAVFTDPILDEPVNWEYTHTFNPGAALMNGQIHLLYRAEDNSGSAIGTYCSRDGLASSSDGLHFTCDPTPSLYPEVDAQETNEWPGGCEDPRLVLSPNGTYVVLYTQWNRSLSRLGVASSTNLQNWTKYGSPFALYGNSSVNSATSSKSAGILTRLVGGQLEAVKHLGQYWMYWGVGSVRVATSQDLINWNPLGPIVLSTRSGEFDSSLVEGGPPAVLTPEGIMVLYNGENASPGDTNLNPGAYSAGQALFDAKEPTKLVGRVDKPFIQPEAPYEVTGQYAAGTTYVQGLVPFQNQWFLYYGAADTFVGVAVCDQTNFGITEPWPTNCYYQDFDGLSVGATNSVDGAALLSTAPATVASVQDGFQKELQLTAHGIPNVTSAFVLPDIASGRAIYGFSAKWDSEFYYTNIPGCGLSFNLSPMNSSQILNLPVEQGYGSGLTVSIDNDAGGTPGFFVRLNNSILASNLFNPGLQWGPGNSFRNYFSVDWNYTNGLTFCVNGVTIFTNVPTPGFAPEPGMFFSWAARTSTNTEDARIDNICVLANANLSPVQMAPPFTASGSTAGNGVTNAFDGNFNTLWQVASSNGWIQASCSNGPQTVIAYSIVSGNTAWQEDPRTWTLLGSDDGTNWSLVDAEYLEGWESNNIEMREVPRTFLVNQPAPYKIYQLNISTNNGASATALSDLVLYTSRSILPSMPLIKKVNLSGGMLQVSGAGGVPLGEYYVLTSTNLLTPPDQWAVVSTNGFDDSGGFSFEAIPLNASALYYQLKLP